MTSRSATPEDLYAVIRLVRPLYKALEAAVERELAPTGIGVTQRAVLEWLLLEGPLTVPAIGRRMIAPRQFIQKIANELLDGGLIERRENQAHKRSVLLALTADGRTAITRILAREAEIMKPIAGELAPDDLATARSVMTVMIDRFRASPADSQSDGDDP